MDIQALNPPAYSIPAHPPRKRRILIIAIIQPIFISSLLPQYDEIIPHPSCINKIIKVIALRLMCLTIISLKLRIETTCCKVENKNFT